MKNSTFFFGLVFLLSISSLATAQRFSREVSFENPADSLKLDSLYKELSRKSRAGEKLDTGDPLWTQIRELREKGWQDIIPSKGFVTYEEALQSGEAKSIKKLTIDRYPEKTLPDLSQFPKLEELEIINSSVKNISRSRRSLRKIKTIAIYNSQVDEKLRLGKLRSLKKLELALNPSSFIPSNTSKMRKLRSISFKNQTFVGQKLNIKRNKKLEELIFENSAFEGEVKISESKSVKWLNINSCGLKEVPEFAFSFPNLVKLQLARNHIEHAPAQLGQLQKLASLSFYENELKTIDPAVFTLSKLEDFDLYHNQLKSLPEDMGKLENLKIFYASFNQLQEIPESIGKLSKLQELYLHHNKLMYLPEDITKLQRLKILHLNHNYFTTFPQGVTQLKGLKEFKISHNHLGSIPKELIELPHIKTLFADENPLEEPFLKKERGVFQQMADSAKINLRL